KKNRLDKPSFKRVFDTGKAIHNDDFVMLFKANHLLEHPKAGFIASLKVGKKATARNKAKRLLREAFRHYLPELKSGVEFVFIAKEKILELDTANLREIMHEELNRIKIPNFNAL
ncbi:MAG: ribonuclease P protein component, partial [Candidatus Dojkabacteria bacterium]|nr:ribonuclease P protein component [Candidatus Dojkabacteria bacterium]